MKSKILILLLALVSVSAFGQQTKLQDLEIQERIRFVGRSDSTTISNVGQIQFDADDDKFRFNDGTGWFSFMKEGSVGAAWPLSGTATLTGTTTIDVDGNDLTIGDAGQTEGYFGIQSGLSFLAYGGEAYIADANGLGFTGGGGADGDLWYTNEEGGFNYWTRLAAAASGNVLLSGTAPSWGKVGLSTHVSGTLGVANGGTGKTSIASNRLLWSTSSNTYGERGVGNLLTMGSTDLELGGTATKTTNLAGDSQELNIGTIASPFGATAFNLGDVDFNASGEFDLSIGTDGIIQNFRMWRFSARPTDLDGYHSVYFTASSGSSGPTGTNKGSVVKISDPVRAVWSTSNKSALLIGESIAQTPSSFTSESGLLYESTWNPNAGTGTLNILHVKPNINTTSSYSGTVRGFYYNPTLTSTTGLTNIAFEATSGNIVFPTLSELDTAAWVLVRENSTGLIKKRSASSLAGSSGWPLTGTASLTGSVTINGGATNDLSLGATSSRLDQLSVYADNSVSFNVASGNNLNTATMTSGSYDLILYDTDGETIDVEITISTGTSDIINIAKDGSLVFSIDENGHIIYVNPPTDCDGLDTGTIWSDSGTLKLCP